MKISYITLLSASLCYGLERPVSEGVENVEPQKTPLNLSEVKPLKKESSDFPLKRSSQENVSEGKVEGGEEEVMRVPAWLGVSGEAVTETLKLHLGIDTGLVLRLVATGSPADLGGLKEHDIIIKVNDTEITNQNRLRDVIYGFEADEVVNVTTVSKGKAVDYKVRLASRPASQGQYGQGRELRKTPGKDRSMRDENQAPRVRERMNRRSGLGGMLKEMGFNKLLKEADPKNRFNIDFKSTSTIMIHDSEGSVEVQVLNGDRQLVVKSKSGEIQYEGPWNTEEDKVKVSENIRQRVENVDFNYKNHNLKFGGSKESEMR